MRAIALGPATQFGISSRDSGLFLILMAVKMHLGSIPAAPQKQCSEKNIEKKIVEENAKVIGVELWVRDSRS